MRKIPCKEEEKMTRRGVRDNKMRVPLLFYRSLSFCMTPTHGGTHLSLLHFLSVAALFLVAATAAASSPQCCLSSRSTSFLRFERPSGSLFLLCSVHAHAPRALQRLHSSIPSVSYFTTPFASAFFFRPPLRPFWEEPTFHVNLGGGHCRGNY